MPTRDRRRASLTRQDQLTRELTTAVEYLQLCDEFFRTRTNDPAVQRDLTTFLTANGWPPPTGYCTFIDLLSFTAAALRRQLTDQP
jgi:hypothetical protein